MTTPPITAQLVTILDNMSEAFCALDGEWRVVFANRHAQELLARPLPDLVDKNVWQVFPDLKNTELYTQLEQAVLKKHAVQFEFCIGEPTRWFSIHAYPSDVGVSVYFSDITTQKQNADALRRSDAYSATVADMGSDWSFDDSVDPDGIITTQDVSAGFTRQLGYTLDDLLDAGGWQLVIHPDDLAQSKADLKRLLKGETIKGELRYVAKSGRIVWSEFETRPQVDAQGLVFRLYGSRRDITRRKDAERALDASTERYRSLFHSIDQGFCIVDIIFDADNKPVDYRFVELNPMFESQTGLKNALGKTARELVPNLEAHWFEIYGHVALTGEPVHFVDGSAAMNRWFDVHAFPVGAPPDRQVAILFTDISERKGIEDALRLREAQLHLITDTTPIMLTQCSRDLHYIFVNRAYANMLGRTPDQLIGKFIPDIIGPEAFDLIKPYLERVFNGEPTEYEQIIPFARVGPHFIRTAYMPTYAADGEVDGWIASITDLTERRRTIEALEASQLKYRRMFDAMSEGVMQLRAIYDESGNTVDFIYLDLNPAWEQFIGARRTDRIGHRASEFYENIPFLQEFGQVVTTGIPMSFEAFQPYIKKDVQISAFTIDPDTVTIIFSDITERKRAQKVLQDAYAVMEERVQERTRELQVSADSRKKLLQQLVTSQEDERKRITRELHDQLGQLITALSVGIKVLRDENDDARFYQRIDQLQELTRQTGETVQSLAYELRPSSLDDLGLDRTLENYLEVWSSRTKIVVDYESSGFVSRLPPYVEIAVYRIIQEALTNVVKHASAAFVSIVIESDADHVSVIVEDDGRGFDVAHTLNSPNIRDSLGLVGMRERAEMLGGTLEIESTPGTGTTVFITIPLEENAGTK